jgi:CubicO group peptidase (beta-lactamase class C family)
VLKKAYFNPVYKVLPEWKTPEILTGFDDLSEPQLKLATKKITLRQLLTHSSGMGYDFLSPDLASWRQWKGQSLGASEEPIVSLVLI